MSALSLVNTVVNNNNFISLPTKVASILRKYGTDAHLYMPGVGYINGFAAGNYLESTGNTNASVDGAVGLVLDAAGSVGAELVTNGTFDSNITGWTTGADPLQVVATWDAGRVKLTRGSGGSAGGLTQPISTTVGKTYCLSFSSDIGVAFRIDSGVVGTTVATGGTYRFYFVATSTTASPYFWNVSPSTVVYLDNVSVREVTGTHATQATTANKPILRRGIVNLLTQNGDFSNAAWTRTNVNILGSVQAPDGSSAASSLNFVFVSPITRLYQDTAFQSVNGTRYTFAVWMRSATPCKISIGVQRSGPADPEQAEVDVTATWQLFVFSHSGAFTGTSAVRGVIFSYDSAFNKNIEVWRPGIFQGTLTAQQIIAAGGIPLTTTAPASSQYGAYAWQFDGSNDVLLLQSAPFQLADDHCVILAHRCGSVGTDSTLFEVGDGTTGSRVASMRLNSGGINVLWSDGSTSRSSFSYSANLGEVYVHTAIRTGNNFVSRKNGVAGGAASGPLAVTISTQAAIGNRTVLAAGEWANGLIYPIIVIKGTVTAADLKTLEKWIGSLAGVPIA